MDETNVKILVNEPVKDILSAKNEYKSKSSTEKTYLERNNIDFSSLSHHSSDELTENILEEVKGFRRKLSLQRVV